MESLPQNNLNAEEAAHRFRIIQYKVREQQIGKIWQEFEDAGFQPVLIKGWAAAQYYPEPFERDFVDIDLIVSPEKFCEAEEFSKNIKPVLAIDLHCGPRHLDSLGFEEIFSNSIYIKCGNTNIRVPRPEDHLRILCVHWLTDGGANRDKLQDIFYLLKNRSSDFDWNRLLNSVNSKRRRWIECTIGLAHKYLGLEIKDTPVEEGAKKLPSWFVKAIDKEWESEVKMQPLDLFLNDKKALRQQIKKRFPPNPVQATVLQEGDFDRYPRLWYQIGNMLSRLVPSLKRIRKRLIFRSK